MTILAKIYRRQGLEVTDWEAYESHKADRRNQNVVNARDVLFRNCIAWDELPGRVGTDQLIAFNVYKPGGLNSEPDQVIAYYPEIGKWFDENFNIRFGVRNLARYIIGDLS